MTDETLNKRGPALKSVPVNEVATIRKDIDVFAGWLTLLENPDPVLRTEAAGRGLKLYDEVARDAHAAAVLQQRIQAVVGKEWEIVPAGSPKRPGRNPALTQEQKIADFVSGVLENCNFDQARADLLLCLLYGYYVLEVLWSVRDGRIVIDRLLGKHPRRFLFTPNRELRLLTPENLIDGEELPPRKFVVMTHGDSDNPYGRGLGQILWWPVWFKKNGIKFWLTFLDKFGMPTAVGKYPAGASEQAKSDLLDALDAIQNETSITIPEDMTAEYLEASRSGTATYEGFADFMDRQISKAVLGQNLTTELKGGGSLAASQIHNEVRQEIIESDADLLDACLNATLIRWIVDYNFPGVTDYPKIKTYAAPKPDLKQQSEIDKTVAVDIGLNIPKRHFYETYGYPIPEEGEETVGGRQAQPATDVSQQTAPGRKSPVAFAEGRDDKDAPDRIAERVAEEAGPVTDSLYMAPLKRLVDRAASLEELRDGILDLYGEMPPAELGAVIARGMMLAELSGRYEVAGETVILNGKKKA